MGKSTWIALLWGWFIPGAGHYYLGYKWKGLALFALLFLLYGAGIILAEYRNVSFREAPYLIVYSLIGSFTLVSLLFTASLPLIGHLYPFAYLLGSLYTAIACLLNGIILLNLFSISLSQKGWLEE